MTLASDIGVIAAREDGVSVALTIKSLLPCVSSISAWLPLHLADQTLISLCGLTKFDSSLQLLRATKCGSQLRAAS